MDLVYNLQTNRVTVLLNGTAYYNCQYDVECPGMAHCTSQRRFNWIDGDNATVTQCVCPWYLGTQGALCDEQTRFTWGLFAINMMTAILASMVVIICTLTFFAMQRQKRKGSRMFQLAIAPVLISALSVVGYSAQWLDRYLFTGEGRQYIVNGEKRSIFWTFERIAFILAFVPYIFALNNFSLLWIEALNGALMLADQKQTAEVWRFKMFLLVYYLVVLTAVVILLALDDFESTALACIPGILIPLFFYAIALRKIGQASNQLSTALEQSTASATKASGVNRLLGRVRNVAIQIFILTFLNALTAGLYAVTENRPDGYHRQFFGMIIFLFATSNLLAIARFMLGMFTDIPTKHRPVSVHDGVAVVSLKA